MSQPGVDLAERNAGFRGYCGAVVFGAYRELFAAIAASAGALTGLLFVAISVAPRRAPVSGLPIIQQVRAAAAPEPVKLNETSGGWVGLWRLLDLDGRAGLVDPDLGGQPGC